MVESISYGVLLIISSKYVDNFHKNAITYYCVKRICRTQKILVFITRRAKKLIHVSTISIT